MTSGAIRLIKTAASTLLLAGFLSACGLKGDLEVPPPLWGDPNREASNSAGDNISP